MEERLTVGGIPVVVDDRVPVGFVVIVPKFKSVEQALMDTDAVWLNMGKEEGKTDVA